MTNNKVAIKLPARTLPFPQSVSIEAQGVLRRLVAEERHLFNARHVIPSLEDRAGWMAIKALADKQYAAFAEAIAPGLRSAVETITIGDAAIHVATPIATLAAWQNRIMS